MCVQEKQIDSKSICSLHGGGDKGTQRGHSVTLNSNLASLNYVSTFEVNEHL